MQSVVCLYVKTVVEHKQLLVTLMHLTNYCYSAIDVMSNNAETCFLVEL